MQFLCLFAALSWQHNQPPGEKTEASVKESKVSKQSHSEKWESCAKEKENICIFLLIKKELTAS